MNEPAKTVEIVTVSYETMRPDLHPKN